SSFSPSCPPSTLYTLSLHDALPISQSRPRLRDHCHLAVSRAIPRPHRDGTPGVAGLLRHLLRHSRAVPAGDGGADPPVGGSAGGAYPPAWRAGLGVPFAGSGGGWRTWPMTLRSSALQPTPRRAQRHRPPRNPFPVGPKSAASSATAP